jgi:hypothetical protein
LKFATIPVDWESLSKDAKKATDFVPGDEIVVAHLGLTGNVLLTSEIPYRRGKGFDITLISGDGRKASFIQTAFGFYSRSYPVSPGSQIVVQKDQK